MKKQTNLTQGSLIPQIILFSLPLIATSVLQLLFNTADTIVVGRWGGATPEACEASLAAVGSCSALINLCINLFLGLSVGAGICVAHDIGAQRHDEIQKTVHTSVVTAIAAGIIVTIFGLFASEQLLTLMGTDAAVLPEATKYIRAVFCGMPANMLYNYCASILRSKGDTVRPLIFLSTAGVINVLLNLFTVIVLGWGAMGVGVATAVSQWISCILIVIYMMRMDGPCRIVLSHLRVDREKLKRLLVIGLPAGLQSTLFSVSNVLIQSSVNSFGPTVVAGNTAGSNLDSYVYAAQNALYHAALTFVAQNAGAKQYKRMKHSILCCSFVVVAVGIAVSGLLYLLGEPLLRIYAPDNESVVQYGMTRLAVFCASYFLCGLMEVGCGAMRGLGKSILPMIVSLVGSCVFRIVWIYTVFQWLPVEETIENTLFRLTMLYVSYPVSWFVTAGVHFLTCFFAMRKYKKTLCANAVAMTPAE